MNVFELAARIFLDTSDYDNGLNEASNKTNKFGDKVKGGLVAVGKMGAAALAATTTAVVGLGASSIKTGMDFDASMSNVAAISGATGKDYDALREKAKEMGATTQFSASEAADAMGYMAMAGWKTGDMLDGIGGIMSLAAASGEDLATTSDIVTDALTAFGLSAKDSGHFADVLAAASSNANTNVSMLGESFKYVAPVAGSMGYSAEDVSVALGLMANNGIKASQAGTALRTLMTNMAKPTKTMAGAMDTLGISLTDSEGNMKSFQEIMIDLRKGFAGLSEAEKANVAASLAGKEGMSGLLAIVNSSEADFDKLTNAIYNSNGAAAEMERVMNDNLAGDIKILKSAFEALQIAISDELSPTLREFVQFGAEGLSRLTTAFQEGGLNAAVEEFGNIFSEGLQMIVDGLPQAVEVGGQVLLAIGKGIAEALPNLILTAIDLLSKLGDYLLAAASGEGDFGSKLGQIIIKIGEFLVVAIPKLAEAALKIVVALAMMIMSAAGELLKAAAELIKKLIEGLAAKAKDVLDAGKNIVKSIVDGIKNKVSDVENSAKDLVEKIKKNIRDKFNELVTMGQQIIDNIKSGITQRFSAVLETFSQLKEQIRAKIDSFRNAFINIGYSIVTGIADGIKRYAAYVINAITGLVSNAWDSVKKFFGISSPSKLMRWAGKMLDAGFAEGITGNLDKVESAVDELNEAASGEITSAVSVEKKAASDNATSGNTYGGVVINVYGAVGQDVNELAEIVSRKINNSVDRKRVVFA